MAEQKGNEKVISDLIDPLIEKARENPGGKEALMMIAFMCDILKRLVGIVFENSKKIVYFIIIMDVRNFT